MSQTSGKRPDPGVDIGHVFLGKYRVEEILGVGGMGVVTKCLHMQLGELVAIKTLRKDVLDDRDAVERFMREAQAAARLRSEYVARVIDVGRFENNVPYMIMEFLDGHDLGELIDERGCLPVPWATEMVIAPIRSDFASAWTPRASRCSPRTTPASRSTSARCSTSATTTSS